ncbi:hypothetical protein [Streptomyces sp. NPDC057426]|uniref:hypothetical protein n=1 Tax=Streptomyces sp. NPDC057426 TaxID=3346128 RepID=UPI0036A4DE1F
MTYRASGRSARRCQGARLGGIPEWHQYSTIDPKRLATRTTSPKVVDACASLNADQWREASWIARALSRP